MLRDDAWRGRDFSGQRVAVIGPGDEVARIVPSVIATAARVKVFQEEARWLRPPGPPAGSLGGSVARLVTTPIGQVADLLGVAGPVDRLVGERLSRRHLRRSVDDAWTRRLLTPHRRFGARGTSVERDYYRALADERCVLVAWPVYALVTDGVRSAEGVEHRVDVVVVTAGSRLRATLQDTDRSEEQSR
ncbi:hypothetical protein [Nocardioides sp. R-C-SC26]|uniref:hypothetical protein n=1 Tax=Nocardioides sp. R-C-SC26 TaxID=2870414 RepID=UPI001E4BC53B|nr:hypothetical protein [Nocardioides sp. R-C-SC26]